jgi:hypothetical protein
MAFADILCSSRFTFCLVFCERQNRQYAGRRNPVFRHWTKGRELRLAAIKLAARHAAVLSQSV